MNLASFVIYCVIVTFTPGPTNIVILSTVQKYGAKKAMEYVWGAAMAFCLLLAASALLNSLLVSALPKVLPVMQGVGSLYMLYLAYKLVQVHAPDPEQKQPVTVVSGFLMQFVNPKVVLFTMTVLPGFVIPYYASVPVLLLFAALVSGIGLLAFVTWVLFGTVFRRLLQKYQRVVTIIMALFLVYSAVMVSGIVKL